MPKPDQKKSIAAAAKSLQSCPTLCDPQMAAHQAPPSMGFFPGKSTGVGCHCLLQPTVEVLVKLGVTPLKPCCCFIN